MAQSSMVVLMQILLRMCCQYFADKHTQAKVCSVCCGINVHYNTYATNRLQLKMSKHKIKYRFSKPCWNSYKSSVYFRREHTTISSP